MSEIHPNGNEHDSPISATGTHEKRQLKVSILSIVDYPPGFSRKVTYHLSDDPFHIIFIMICISYQIYITFTLLSEWDFAEYACFFICLYWLISQRTLCQQVVAEVVATFLLVFVTCGASALTTSDQRKVSQLGASVAGGLIVTVMIYAVGHISGAHMNPAVTIAFATVGHFRWIQVGE